MQHCQVLPHHVLSHCVSYFAISLCRHDVLTQSSAGTMLKLVMITSVQTNQSNDIFRHYSFKQN